MLSRDEPEGLKLRRHNYIMRVYTVVLFCVFYASIFLLYKMIIALPESLDNVLKLRIIDEL